MKLFSKMAQSQWVDTKFVNKANDRAVVARRAEGKVKHAPRVKTHHCGRPVDDWPVCRMNRCYAHGGCEAAKDTAMQLRLELLAYRN